MNGILDNSTSLTSRLWAALAVTAVVVLTACGTSSAASFDGSARPSEEGHFVGSVSSTPPVPPVNEMHNWTFHLEDADGVPIEGASITVHGDMPAHGHGLPTEPRVTDYLGNGDYLVEGMQFQMGGEWYVEFVIAADGIEDVVRFDFTL